ncbi:MAG: crossover junction endodeoxyribonuclease RuvC [Candidatus Omnitrophota bacterium]
MRILGIDPGLDITGYGVVDSRGDDLFVVEAGIIKSSNKSKLPLRLKTIYSQLSDLILAVKPDVCAVEQLYSHYKHPMTSILMGHARGVVLFSCSQVGVEIIDYPAKTVKRSITGNGNASKLQVKMVVEGILGIKENDFPVDVTDALALCITYARHNIVNPLVHLRGVQRG